MLDPGGRWANRPRASLAMIFSPLLPQCTVSADDRHGLLASLAAEFPEVTVEICTRMIESRSGIIDTARKPAVRSWAPTELRAVTMTDYWADVQFAAQQLLMLAGTNVSIWHELLSNLKQFRRNRPTVSVLDEEVTFRRHSSGSAQPWPMAAVR